MRRALICTALLIALAGCAHTTSVGASRAVKVGLSEYRLVPGDLHAHAGELAILVHNYGRLTHNLAVSLDGQAVAATKPIAPGASIWLYVLLVPGHYEMASNLLSDQALGMYGTLAVTK